MRLVITEKHCFYPDSVEYSTPAQWGLEFESLRIPGPDGGMLTGWHIPPHKEAETRGVTVLHLHGNAQNMSAHLYGSYFLALAGFRLITFDYRGYGDSLGEPTLAGIIEDGAAAVKYLHENPPGPGEPLTVFGQSMGAFTAAHILPRFPSLSRCLLEAGLISFRFLFIEAYPGADVRVPDGVFSTLGPLAESAVPKLFIHGDMDPVVPMSHSVKMHQAAAEPKDLVILPGVGHIDALNTNQAGEYRRKVVEFLAGEKEL